MDNPFADLYPEGGAAQDTQESPVPVTSYSLPAVTTGGTGDEMYDPDTARGVGIGEVELTPGVVAVNPKVYPHGTIFKDTNNNQVFIAADTHGNKNPNVIDVYTPPSQYSGESGERNLVPIGQIPKSAIPKDATTLRNFLSQYGHVPEGESASESLAAVGQAEPKAQATEADNPFADLYPQAKQGQASPSPTPVSADNPFSDLYSKEGKPIGQAQPNIPWYQKAYNSFTQPSPEDVGKKPVGAMEAFGRGIAGSLAATNELLTQAIGVFPYLEDKTAQAFGIDSNLYNKWTEKVHAMGIGKPGEEAAAIKPTEYLTTGGKITMPLGEMAADLPAIIGSAGVGTEASAVKALSQAEPTLIQAVKDSIPQIQQGLKAMSIPAAKAGLETQQQAAEQGDSVTQQIAKGLASAVTTDILGAVPLAARSKIANPLLRFMEQGAYGYVTGIPVNEFQKQAQSWINGKPYIPSDFKEMVIQAAPMGLMTGIFGLAHAPEVSGPKIAPSENPVVNEKQDAIIQGADQQFSQPIQRKEEVAAAPAAKGEEIPMRPAFEGQATAPAADLSDLYLQQMEHEPGTPEHTAIQAQIDAAKRGEQPPKEEPSAAEQAQPPVSAAGEAPVAEPTAEAPAEAQPTQPNAVQVEKTGEVGVRNAPAVGEGVGEENKPEVAPEQGEAPKEEVVTPNTLFDAKTPEEVDAFVKAKRQRLSQKLPTNTKNESVNIRNKVELGKRSKALGMQSAARKRQLTGNLTAKEQAAKDKREASNYIGKPISVDGKNGTVIGNPFGRVKVRFADGTESTHPPEKIEAPIEEKPTTPTIETTGEGQLFGEDTLPFNLAGETMAPEPERVTVGTDVEQQLPMGEAPATAPEAPKKSAPIRDILYRFQNGEEDGINTLQELHDAIRNAARKLRNRNLRETAAEIQEAIDYGVDVNEGKDLVERSLATLEREANYLDKPPEKEQSFTYKSRRVQEEAYNKSLQEHLDALKAAEKLKKENPEAYAGAVESQVRDYLIKRLRNEGGYTELPRIVYDALVSVGNSIRKAGQSFADWSKEMVSRLGDGVKGYLRQAWDAYKKSRFGRETGAIDIGQGGRPERFSPEEAKRRAAVKRLYDIVSQNEGKPGFEKFSDLLARKYPDLKNDPASLRELYSMASGERGGFTYPSKEAAPAAAAATQGEMFQQRTTGLKKAVVREERLARNLEDIPPEERPALEEKVATAAERIKSDPSVAPSIVSQILDSKNPHISLDNAAALLAERNRVMTERSVYEGILDDESKSPAERQFAKEQLDGIEQQLDRLDKAQRATGSEWSLIGHLYQRMIAEDYSLAAMETKFRRAKDAPLTESERKSLKERSDKIQKLNEEVIASQDRLTNAQEQADLQNAYWKTIQELKAELASRPKIEPQIQRIIDLVGSSIKSQANKARERIRQRQAEGRFMAGLDPEDIIDHAIIGADYILEGATDVAKFTARMASELGEYVRPYIKQIFAASQKEYDRIAAGIAKSKSNEVKKAISEKAEGESIPTIRARAKAESFLPGFDTLDSELTHKVVYDLARQHILEGMTGEDNIMKAVHDDIRDIFPDATERDVRRAFSEYGKAKFPSKEADRVALAELRTLTRLQESIDRLTEGLPALRTGLQRNKVTQAIREKQRQLNELLKKVKLPPTAAELASRDAAKQTALRNRIADLDKQLRTGEKIKRTPTEPDSQATEDLRLEKNALEQLLKEVEGEAKTKKTPEERYNEMRQKAIQKRIAEIQERRKNKDYSKQTKRVAPQKFEETQRLELELKKEKNDFERERIKYEEERKPRWQKKLQSVSEAAKGFAISGYHSAFKILNYGITRLATMPIHELTKESLKLIPGFKEKVGELEMGGTYAGRMKEYYAKGIPEGIKEAMGLYRTGTSKSEELFGKVRPNIARWYDFIGGRLHAALKHPIFNAAEQMRRYSLFENAEKQSPGITKDPFVRAMLNERAYKEAMAEKLQQSNWLADKVAEGHRMMEQVDPATGKAKISKTALSHIIKIFVTKGIIKTPINYVSTVLKRGVSPFVGPKRLGVALYRGIDNLTPKEYDALAAAWGLAGLSGVMSIWGLMDSFKKKEDRIFGGYYQPGRKENDKDAKWGTIRINGHTFSHFISHNPETEIAQFWSTVGRVYQEVVKKSDTPSAIAEGLLKAMVSFIGQAPVVSPITRYSRPNASLVNEIVSGLLPQLLVNVAEDTDSDIKRKPGTLWEKMKMEIPGLRQTVPVAKPTGKKWYQ